MSFPEFNEFGDLPEGVYEASLSDVIARFGSGSSRRSNVTNRLPRVGSQHFLGLAWYAAGRTP